VIFISGSYDSVNDTMGKRMPDTVDIKLARIEENIKSLKENTENGLKDLSKKQDDTIQKLDKDFVTQNDLELRLKLLKQEFQPFKTGVLWLFGVIGLETAGLIFFLIRSIIGGG
jgi:hypothetical protein